MVNGNANVAAGGGSATEQSSTNSDVAPAAKDAEPRTTKFLALDKCLPGRDFLQMVELPVPQDDSGDAFLRYDPDWLAVVRATLPCFHVSHDRWRPPPEHAIATRLEECCMGSCKFWCVHIFCGWCVWMQNLLQHRRSVSLGQPVSRLHRGRIHECCSRCLN